METELENIVDADMVVVNAIEDAVQNNRVFSQNGMNNIESICVAQEHNEETASAEQGHAQDTAPMVETAPVVDDEEDVSTEEEDEESDEVRDEFEEDAHVQTNYPTLWNALTSLSEVDVSVICGVLCGMIAFPSMPITWGMMACWVLFPKALGIRLDENIPIFMSMATFLITAPQDIQGMSQLWMMMPAILNTNVGPTDFLQRVLFYMTLVLFSSVAYMQPGLVVYLGTAGLRCLMADSVSTLVDKHVSDRAHVLVPVSQLFTRVWTLFCGLLFSYRLAYSLTYDDRLTAMITTVWMAMTMNDIYALAYDIGIRWRIVVQSLETLLPYVDALQTVIQSRILREHVLEPIVNMVRK